MFDVIHKRFNEHDELDENALIHYLSKKEIPLKGNPRITKHIQSLMKERDVLFKAKPMASRLVL